MPQLIGHLVTICLGVISFLAENGEQQHSRYNDLPKKADGEQAFLKSSTQALQTVHETNTGRFIIMDNFIIALSNILYAKPHASLNKGLSSIVLREIFI